MYGYGNSMFLATHGILARGGTPPANTVAPVISGSTSLGSVLTSTTGTWTGDAPITYSYQWKRNGIDIGSATSSTYTIVVADSAANLTCQVTATNAAGFASAVSNTITAQTFTAPVNTVAPAITGTAQEGQTLTCSTGTWTGNPTPTYAYQWKRNNVNIGSATNSTYLLVTADVGQSIKCTVTATNAISSVNADSNTVTPTAAVDPDAQAFITAAAITNPTQQSAINQLVVDLKGYGVWTKMKALYPFVGGTASTHKWNLKDPRDLDVAFRLVFNGGWTHSANGALPNGTNAYADTKFVPSTHLGVNSNSLGYYSGTNLSETNSDPCNIGTLITITQGLVLAKTNTLLAGRLNGSAITYSTTTMRGLFSGSRQSSTITDIYLNGSQVGTGNSGGTLPNNNVFLGNISFGFSNSPYSVGYVKNDFRFAYLSDGLNDTEMANLYAAVQAYQTTLGRQVP